MAARSASRVLLLLLALVAACHGGGARVSAAAAGASPRRPNWLGGLSRASFPKGFVFGTATSAYQVEGMATGGGRGPSIWDAFAHVPGNIVGNQNADVTTDQYHRYKEAIKNGTKENDVKRKRKESIWCRSPYTGPRKRAKKSLFGDKDVLISTDYINENHIEAARVYIQTLTDKPKHRQQTVVHMTGIGGETCTAEMLRAITSRRWLNGAVINCYCNHMLSRNTISDRHVLTSWTSHLLIQRGEGRVQNSNMNYMEYFTKESKTVSRVVDEYFAKDKAFFPFNEDNVHWMTVVMHKTKKEFQVLNSLGTISKRVRSKIAVMRAEIAIDTKMVNSSVGTDHPDVSKWPIRQYDMPLQHDSVSCGLFVTHCVQYWDGDDWTHEFNQEEVDSSRGRILAEILFSESNTLSKVKDKILKIMEKQ